MKKMQEKKNDYKSENLLDNISRKNIVGKDDCDDRSEKVRVNFLKNKNKLKFIIPNKEKSHKKINDRLGYFKTDLGIISVGYGKFKKSSSFGFTLLSDESEKTKKNIEKKDFKDKHNYFKKNFNNREENMKFSDISFEYNPKQKIIKDLNNNSRFFKNDDLLYKGNEENKSIKFLRDNRKRKLIRNSEFENALSDFNEVKKQKEKDNNYFKNKIESFVKLFKRNKLKKLEDSDEIKKSKLRIIEMSKDNIFLYLVNRIKKYMKIYKTKDLKVILNMFDKTNLSKDTLERILSYFGK